MTAPQPIQLPETISPPVGGENSISQVILAYHNAVAGGPPPNRLSTPEPSSAGDFLDLRIWAESFNDAQQHRIATVNRMERGGVDADLLQGHRDLLDASEHAFKLAMVRSYRRVVRAHMPALEEWQKASFGIGEHLLARLLGHLGHPVIATPYVWADESPEGHVCIEERCGKRHLVALQPFSRTVGQLWSYCGHGAPSKRRKGMSQDEAFGLGNPVCKFLVHLLAEGTIKCQPQPQEAPVRPAVDPAGATDSPPTDFATAGSHSAGSPQPRVATQPTGTSVGDKFYYRAVYDTRKAATADREWTDGHRHADALRIVGKEILRDLWTHAQAMPDFHGRHGAGGPA